MFTGIVEEVGTIENIKKQGISAAVKIRCKKILEDTRIGDSIAVNGICLTVTAMETDGFWADVMTETMYRSSFSETGRYAKVNLERAMAAGGRFGGHMVSGHIDGTGKIVHIKAEENAVWYTIQTGEDILRYIVEKGSVAVDGISLTIAKASEKEFKVSIIPHTRQETALTERTTGSRVNLECDIIGKYVERFLKDRKPEQKQSRVTEAFLTAHGFC